jgi:pimeloyl-ACP methyl ester carboxylesterase
MVFGMIGHKRSLAAGVIAPELLDWYLALLAHTPTNANDTAADARVISFFAPQMRALAIARDELAPLAPRTHFLWGTHDNFGGVDVARALIAQLPGAALEIVENGGHLPWLDDPAQAVAWARRALTAPQESARAA